jgi:hypothetical protein
MHAFVDQAFPDNLCAGTFGHDGQSA